MCCPAVGRSSSPFNHFRLPNSLSLSLYPFASALLPVFQLPTFHVAAACAFSTRSLSSCSGLVFVPFSVYEYDLPFHPIHSTVHSLSCFPSVTLHGHTLWFPLVSCVVLTSPEDVLVLKKFFFPHSPISSFPRSSPPFVSVAVQRQLCILALSFYYLTCCKAAVLLPCFCCS